MQPQQYLLENSGDSMSLRSPRGGNRGLRVQWADEAEAPAALAHQLDGGAESNEDEDEALFPSPSKASRLKHCPSILQRALPTSPAAQRRCYYETRGRDDDSSSEEKLDWRDDARSCTSGSTCSWTCSDEDEETTSSTEDFGDRQAMAAMMKERGLRGGTRDNTLGAAAPMHASSALLSPAVTERTTLLDRETCAFRSRLGQHPSSPLFPEEASTGSSDEDGSGSGYSPRRAFAPSDLSPEPVAVFRSKANDGSHTPSSQHYYHSSTAVHEPRARCGCRGLTVRVDSGPLGLSLEASYRMEQGFVLKQTWSDCAVDRGLFAHSVHVQNLPGTGGDDHVSALDLGLEGRSSSSGLIKVRTVGLESGGGATNAAPSSTRNVVVGPPLPLRPGIASNKEVGRSVLVGVLEVEEGDILVRVNNVQVTKKSFTDVVRLLNEAERPTRLAFVRHACGRRFVGREKGGGAVGFCGLTAAATRPRSPCRATPGAAWVGCCGKWRKSGCGCEQPPRAASVGPPVSSPSPQKSNTRYRQIEAEADGCPVAVLLRARRQLRSGGIGQWHEVVASRGRLWQKLLRTLSPDSHSDRAKLRKLTGSLRSLEEHTLPGMTGITKRKLMSNYQRLVNDRKFARNGGSTGGYSSKASRELAASVWKDVNRTMSPRRPGGRPGFFSASQLGGGGFVCPAHFAGGSKHAVFRVAYATASTVQFVSGMSYMAALMLVREPVESMAYATLVTLLQERMMQALFPLGDVDLLDAYHLCGGRVVTFRPSGASRSPVSREATAGADAYRGRRCRVTERGGITVDGVSVGSSGDHHDANVHDGGGGVGGADRAGGREIYDREEEPTQQVVIGEMLPRLVRAFGKALRRRLPALHKHLCKQAIPMSFLCAEWFTTAYARSTPLPLALCAFDLFLVRLDDVMLRLGLAILEVLAPALKTMNGLEILLQYGGLTANVCFEEVLRCMLATQPRQAPLLQAQCGKNPPGSGKRGPCAVS